MPSAAVVAPIVLPLIAAAVIAGFGASGVNLGRMAAGIGAWSSALALVAVWLPVRSSLELILGQLGYGSTFDLRLDAVSVAFGLMIAVPAAVLLTLQPRTWQESALAMLSVAAAMAAVEAGGVVLPALAGSTAATLPLVSRETEDPRSPRPGLALLVAGWLPPAPGGGALPDRGRGPGFSAGAVGGPTKRG